MALFNYYAAFAGLIGVTLVAASGDGGAAEVMEPHQCGQSYELLFPASSPYVTAVGATQGIESGTAEVGCSTSTGALSNCEEERTQGTTTAT